GQAAAVDAEGELDDPGAVDLLDGRLVDGPAGVDLARGGLDLDVDRRPLLDGVVAVGDAPHHLPDAVRVRLGEEADVPEVDADERDVAAADELGGAQEGAVTTEDEDELGVVGGVVVELADGLDTERAQPRL